MEWLTNGGNTDTVLTAGTGGSGRGRQLWLWDPRAPSAPLASKLVDYSSGQLLPLYDEGTGVLLTSGRGDNSIRILDLGPRRDSFLSCGDLQVLGDPLCGLAMLPKQTCDVAAVETMKVLRMTPSEVVPISFVLPRAANLKSFFQDDIFPPARAPAEALSSAEWFEGKDQDPLLESLRPAGMPLLSEKPPEPERLSKAAVMRQELAAKQEEDEQRESVMSRMATMAVQRSQFHPNQSMGRRSGVDAEPILDSDDDGWSDDEDED